MVPDELALALRTRAGSREQRGVFRSERVFYDFLVNGASLLDEIARRNAANADMTSVLTLDWPIGPGSEDLAPLLGTTPSTPGDGRIVLYVCPECGHIGCGALTAVLCVATAGVTWSDFGWLTSAEVGRQGLDGLGPFTFDRPQYVTALSSAPEFVQPRRDHPRPRCRPWSLRRPGR